jgi:hypothetical protein
LALTSDESTVGLAHRTTTGARLLYGILPKNLAYATDGQVRTVTTFLLVEKQVNALGVTRVAWRAEAPEQPELQTSPLALGRWGCCAR